MIRVNFVLVPSCSCTYLAVQARRSRSPREGLLISAPPSHWRPEPRIHTGRKTSTGFAPARPLASCLKEEEGKKEGREG